MRHSAIILLTLLASALSAEPTVHNNDPKLIWNASASAPIGLYRLTPGPPFQAGELVVLVPPVALANFLASRGYLPRGVSLIKHIAALSGDVVCRIGATITVDDQVYGTALERDSRGRPLPVWQGCWALSQDQVFLMNSDVADSFDGRYFGPLSIATITAKALPVFTDDDGDGRFQWHVGDPAVAP